MPSQPIGYADPPPGRKMTGGVLDPMTVDPPIVGLIGLGLGMTPQIGAPVQASTPGAGTIFTGFGQAPDPPTFAPLMGLNCT